MAVTLNLSHAEKKILLSIARRAIEAVVRDERYTPDDPGFDNLREKMGVFVTLHRNSELRGCIGYIESRAPLFETVAEVAAKSAVADPRFEPVSKDEVNSLDIEISVLSKPQPVMDTSEIKVGRDGLIMERGFHRGLLLPQVAVENQWTREEFLRYTCLKAGMPSDCYKDPGTKIYSFTALVFSEKEIFTNDKRHDFPE
ncbi:MAG: AmmeMemoRadiSam system protein A [Candidatus Kryptoniota bacterium]